MFEHLSGPTEERSPTIQYFQENLMEWSNGSVVTNSEPWFERCRNYGRRLEGFRLLRVAFEPDVNVPGGCDKDTSNVLNGSHMDIVVLVKAESITNQRILVTC